ncbi:MAG: periplasmic heavy metal sensor [Desulfobacterales bacterium]|jgi:Spy/CpxP family protein refolding chaperone
MKNLSKVIIVVAIIGIVGYAATSFAGGGRGWGGGYCGGPGSGWAQRGYAGPEYQGNLSDEEIAKLNEERQAFFEETSELRANLYQKKLALRAELAKKDPDVKKAVDLQKEISELKGQLDLKRVEQHIKMKKENPEYFSGRGYGYGGQGMGRGMDRGFYGRGMGPGYGGRGGACWQ